MPADSGAAVRCNERDCGPSRLPRRAEITLIAVAAERGSDDCLWPTAPQLDVRSHVSNWVTSRNVVSGTNSTLVTQTSKWRPQNSLYENDATSGGLPIGSIGMELYVPLPGGVAIGGRFAPQSIRMPGLREIELGIAIGRPRWVRAGPSRFLEV